jgi:Trypsin-co-occurring domain 2
MANDDPTLGELIMQLRRELTAAQNDDPDNPIRFAVGPVELETTLAVTRATEGNVGFVLKVISLGGKRSDEDTNTTRVHLTLTPADVSKPDQSLYVSATDTEPGAPRGLRRPEAAAAGGTGRGE